MPKKIDIPFKKEMIIELMSGRKTMTTRTKRYGKIGDYFIIAGKFKFILMGVEKKRLAEIAESFYEFEGFRSTYDFIEFWKTIHRDFEPDKEYWLHTFKRDNRWNMI